MGNLFAVRWLLPALLLGTLVAGCEDDIVDPPAPLVLSAGPEWTGGLEIGQVQRIVLDVRGADGGRVEGANANWISSEPSVTAVEPQAAADGMPTALVVALGAGNADISVEVSYPGSAGSLVLPVTVLANSWPDTVNATNTDTLAIQVPAGSARDVQATWASSNEAVFRVRGLGGSEDGDTVFAELEALAPGSAAVILRLAGVGLETREIRRPILVAQKWRSVSAGFLHTCALNVQREVYCWGSNRFGEVGDGTYDRRVAPVPVVSAARYDEVYTAGGTAPSNGPEDLARQGHSCARQDARLDCWGRHLSGQLGTSRGCDVLENPGFDERLCTETRPTPFEGPGTNSVLIDTAAVTLGSNFTCLSTYSLSSGDLISPISRCWGNTAFLDVAVDLGSYGNHLMSGLDFHCSAPFDGPGGSPPVFCSGGNDFGQTGSGSTESVIDTALPVDAPNGEPPFVPVDPRKFSAGNRHACVLVGELLCWGSNSRGQIGPSGSTDTCSRQSVPCSRSAVEVNLGTVPGTTEAVGLGGEFSCVLNDAGALYCWGDNRSGQLGDGGTVDRALPSPTAEGLRFVSFDAGANHICGIDEEGSLFCWGANAEGQLGVGDTEPRTRPARVVEPGG